MLCGCFGLVAAFEGNLDWTAYFVGMAAVFDFFDGFAARLLKVSSAIGKDLDSLADMVTFGLVPGVVMFKLLLISSSGQLEFNSFDWNSATVSMADKIIPFIAFLIPVFSALRLAKFNNDTRQTDSFIGLPTPANAIFICSIPLIIMQLSQHFIESSFRPGTQFPLQKDPLWELLNNTFTLLTLVIVFSFLLVAELPLFALKFKSFGWKGNEIRFIFLGLSLVLLITLKFIGIPLIIILYILLSVINNLIKKKNSPSQ